MTSTRTERPLARAPTNPPGAPLPAGPGPRAHDARARVQQLRAEAEATSERTEKAALLYEAGCVDEVHLGQPAQAVQDYLASYNADNRSRLPLHALVRMFERRRAYKNLARLYEAEVRSARRPEERASALTDLAVLTALSEGGDAASIRTQLEQALEHEPKRDAALLLEWNRRAVGDLAGAARALAERAASSDDFVHRGALLLELAMQHEAEGKLDLALQALRTAALGPEPASEVCLLALARFARQHGFAQELVEVSERSAASLASELAQLGRDANPELATRLRARALGDFYEAARLRSTSLNDPRGSLRSVESARALAPDDLLFSHMRMLAYDLLEDRERSAAQARALLDAGFSGEPSAALHFRIAEHALVAGEAGRARDQLVEAIAVAGGSAAAEAILDDLLLDEGLHEERIARREAVASGSTSTRALSYLGEAAQMAAQELHDAERALRLFTRAEALAPGDPMLLREAYGTALDLNDPALARFAIERLLGLELMPDERAALRLHQLELARGEERLLLLDAELTQPARAPQLLKIALGDAAAQRDYPRLALAHEALAADAHEAEAVAAALSAAARAWLRAGDRPRAKALLERAIAQAPAQRYPLLLLEELLREEGDASGALELLRGASGQPGSARAAELHFLSAGAAAELAGDAERAAGAYREALEAPEPSLGAMWALYRLGQRQRSVELEREARVALSAREQRAGRTGVDTVLLAEHYDLVDRQPQLAEPLLERALEDEDVGHHAAVALALLPSASIELRERALSLLATRATDSLRPALLRELGGQLVAHGAPRARVLNLVERVLRVRPDDRWAAWTRTHTGLTAKDAPAHEAALTAFAEVTTDPNLAQVARAEALWARQLSAPEQPLDEALATLLPEGDTLGQELAEVVAALGSPGRDGAVRLRALEALTRGAEPEMRPERLLSLARARLAQGDSEGALEPLEELLALRPEQLAGWELAHVAARKAGHVGLLADAAETLAEHFEGEAALELFEESATLRMDQLDDLAGAERIFVRLLALAPERPLAYTRLHELLKQRNDVPKLLAIVRRRAQGVDDPEELVRLLHEVARLERQRGELDAALAAIDELLMLEDEHVGALALSAEIHTARGNFGAAVAALDRLGRAGSLPLTQRRLACLGAADFLENKLDDRAGALRRLELLLELTPDDAKLHVRIAELAERHGAFERAASAVTRAIALERESAPRALSAVWLGRLSERLERPEQAIDAYRQALTWAPDHLEAARALLALREDREVIARLESELRRQAMGRPEDADTLRRLRTLAALARDADLDFLALSALAALGTLENDEQSAHASARTAAIARHLGPLQPLDEADLQALVEPALDARLEPLARTVFSAAAELDQLTPARFGVGRGQRIGPRDPHPLRDEVRALAAALGLTLGDFYVGGKEPTQIAALPREGEVGFVFGTDIVSPLVREERHAVALALAAVRLDALPLLGRSAADAARLVLAALASEGVALPPAVMREGLGELPKSVGKALSRKQRRTVAELGRGLPLGAGELEAHCRTTLVQTRRLALLLSGELSAALADARDDPGAVLDLRRTWLGAPLRISRRKLGLAL